MVFMSPVSNLDQFDCSPVAAPVIEGALIRSGRRVYQLACPCQVRKTLSYITSPSLHPSANKFLRVQGLDVACHITGRGEVPAAAAPERDGGRRYRDRHSAGGPAQGALLHLDFSRCFAVLIFCNSVFRCYCLFTFTWSGTSSIAMQWS